MNHSDACREYHITNKQSLQTKDRSRKIYADDVDDAVAEHVKNMVSTNIARSNVERVLLFRVPSFEGREWTEKARRKVRSVKIFQLTALFLR